MSKKPAPLTQGDVTGECVIYSAINAVRFLWPEHFGELEACEKLYDELVGRMEANGLKEMLVEGTERRVAFEVGQTMTHLLFLRRLNLNISSLQHSDIPRIPFFSLLLRDALSPGSVAILGLDDPWDHWTVVTRATSAALFFYDSYAPDRLKHRQWRCFTLAKEADKIQLDAPATVIYRRLDARIA